MITTESVALVIPVLDEAENLRWLLPRLPRVDHLIIVDGCNDPETLLIVNEHASHQPWVTVMGQQRAGKGNALVTGFYTAALTSRYVVMMDADGSHHPDEVYKMVEALTDGFGFAKGSRFIRGGGSHDITPYRRAGNAMLNGIMNQTFGARNSDLCYGLMAFRTSVLNHLALPDPFEDGAQWGDGFEIETLLACRMAELGVRTVEVPSVEHARIHGHSHLRPIRDGLRVLRTIRTEGRRRNMLTTLRLANSAGLPHDMRDVPHHEPKEVTP